MNDAGTLKGHAGRLSRFWLVLASGLVLTAVATSLSVRIVQERERAAAEAAIADELSRLESRVTAYLALLRATRAFVEAQGPQRLEPANFATFIAGLRTQTDYPGIQGIGWSPRVGPDGSRFAVRLLEPMDERNRAALGFDMHSEPVRAAAMDRARDAGEPAMTGSVVLKQEIHSDKSAGFLIYEPLYAGGELPESVPQRRDRLLGFVYAPFRADDFFHNVFAAQLVRVRSIHATSAAHAQPGTLLWGEEAPGFRGRPLSAKVTFAGQPWLLQFERTSRRHWADWLTPAVVLLSGLALSTVLATLTRQQVRARERADDRADELRQRVQFAELLVGIVSHDLRNPLNVIRLNTALLARASLTDEFARCVHRIENSADQCQRMTRDLLDFTQARLSGGIPVVRAPGDIHEIVQQAVDEMQLAHPGRSIQFTRSGDGSGTWDAGRIGQVVSNLVNNALVYGSAEAPIRVRLDGLAAQVCLAVHNEGEPIRPELQSELFEPLRQGSRAGAQGRNIGLGLYIVQQIARAHGGTVTCRSTASEGTDFIVELPRTEH